MGGNITDSPPDPRVVLPRLMTPAGPGGVGVVGTLLGPEGTGPTPHPRSGGGVRLVFVAGLPAVWRGLLSLAVRALPAIPAFPALPSSWLSRLVRAFGVGGAGCGAGGGESVWVAVGCL